MANTCLLAMWCPVYRRRDSSSGAYVELENPVGDAKGKDASVETTRSKVPMSRLGVDCPVLVIVGGRRQPSVGGTSRVTGDSQARICEGLGVKFPGSTRCRRARMASNG